MSIVWYISFWSFEFVSNFKIRASSFLFFALSAFARDIPNQNLLTMRSLRPLRLNNPNPVFTVRPRLETTRDRLRYSLDRARNPEPAASASA